MRGEVSLRSCLDGIKIRDAHLLFEGGACVGWRIVADAYVRGGVVGQLVWTDKEVNYVDTDGSLGRINKRLTNIFDELQQLVVEGSMIFSLEEKPPEPKEF